MFIELGMRDAASKELQSYKENRQKMGWCISDRLRSLSNTLNSMTGAIPSIELNHCISLAEDYAFDNYDWANFVLTEKWKNDNVEHCNYSNGDD